VSLLLSLSCVWFVPLAPGCPPTHDHVHHVFDDTERSSQGVAESPLHCCTRTWPEGPRSCRVMPKNGAGAVSCLRLETFMRLHDMGHSLAVSSPKGQGSAAMLLHCATCHPTVGQHCAALSLGAVSQHHEMMWVSSCIPVAAASGHPHSRLVLWFIASMVLDRPRKVLEAGFSQSPRVQILGLHASPLVVFGGRLS
jgi:hypothetical protein